MSSTWLRRRAFTSAAALICFVLADLGEPVPGYARMPSSSGRAERTADPSDEGDQVLNSQWHHMG